jgi:hypothetical protein
MVNESTFIFALSFKIPIIRKIETNVYSLYINIHAPTSSLDNYFILTITF